MRRRSIVLPLLATAALAGCGNDERPAQTTAARAAVPAAGTDAPRPSAVAAALARIADVPAAERRLSYVNFDLAGDVAAVGDRRLVRRVLGDVTARSGTAVRVGDAVVRHRAGDTVIRNAGARLRQALEDPAPTHNALTAETPSAVQSCLGDAAIEAIVGPARLGYMSAIGASLRDDGSGTDVLSVCAAPHYARDLARIERRLRRLLPAAAVEEHDIGERDIVSAVVAVTEVRERLVHELLAGDAALLTLAGA